MKVSRQARILEIIENKIIETQEELLRELNAAGYKVTQATVSRDIKELKLIKVTGKGGRQSYATMKNIGTIFDERVATVFRESVLTVDTTAFLIVLRTLPAMAQAAALAIDAMEWTEIVGTIAGDDTIFVAVREEKDVTVIANKFRRLMKENQS
ncbi:arginine repressor [Eubacterium aggregans]|uniref:arginine repressor n=1 Tax=Eubacterium aggregans TaxID=81409 RepID=UPI003F32899A